MNCDNKYILIALTVFTFSFACAMEEDENSQSRTLNFSDNLNLNKGKTSCAGFLERKMTEPWIKLTDTANPNKANLNTIILGMTLLNQGQEQIYALVDEMPSIFQRQQQSLQQVDSVLNTGQEKGLSTKCIFTDEKDMLSLERQARKAKSKKTKTQKNKSASPKDLRRVLEGQGLGAIQE